MSAEQITPGERRELRSVVRSQIKVLRAEVGQREMELNAQVENRLAERYSHDDARADDEAYPYDADSVGVECARTECGAAFYWTVGDDE